MIRLHNSNRCCDDKFLTQKAPEASWRHSDFVDPWMLHSGRLRSHQQSGRQGPDTWTGEDTTKCSNTKTYHLVYNIEVLWVQLKNNLYNKFGYLIKVTLVWRGHCCICCKSYYTWVCCWWLWHTKFHLHLVMYAEIFLLDPQIGI